MLILNIWRFTVLKNNVNKDIKQNKNHPGLTKILENIKQSLH